MREKCFKKNLIFITLFIFVNLFVLPLAIQALPPLPPAPPQRKALPPLPPAPPKRNLPKPPNKPLPPLPKPQAPVVPSSEGVSDLARKAEQKPVMGVQSKQPGFLQRLENGFQGQKKAVLESQKPSALPGATTGAGQTPSEARGIKQPQTRAEQVGAFFGKLIYGKPKTFTERLTSTPSSQTGLARAAAARVQDKAEGQPGKPAPVKRSVTQRISDSAQKLQSRFDSAVTPVQRKVEQTERDIRGMDAIKKSEQKAARDRQIQQGKFGQLSTGIASQESAAWTEGQ